MDLGQVSFKTNTNINNADFLKILSIDLLFQTALDGVGLKSSTSTPKIPSVLVPVILSRLEDLEKRMDQFTKSLPKKVQLYCEKYISNRKFRYDESGQLLVAVDASSSCCSTSLGKKPIWERSPTIKPKVNCSSEIRQKTGVSSSLNDKENVSCSVTIDPNTNCIEGVETYLKHLEKIVNDLKEGFVQLLLKKVVRAGGSNGRSLPIHAKSDKHLNLNTICKALHNL